MRREPVASLGPPIAAVGGLVLLVAVAAVSGATARTPAPSSATAPVSDTTLVCPLVTGQPVSTATTATVADLSRAIHPGGSSAGRVTATVLTGGHSRSVALRPAPLAAVHSRAAATQSVAVHVVGGLAGSVAVDQLGLTDSGRYRSLFGGNCAAPTTDWWFAGADGRVGYGDRLVLANPAPVAAEVAVSLWSAKGPLSPPHLDAVQVRPQSAVAIGLATVAPDQPSITIHVHATSGAVTAGLLDQRTAALQSNGGDLIPPTQPPGRSAVIPGYVGSPDQHLLVLGDPGQLDATVGLRLVTTSGSFTPSGTAQLLVRAGHTRVVDLNKAFNGANGAVSIASDQPVVSQGMVVVNPASGRLRPDLAWLAATPPLARTAGVATATEPDGGRCQLLLTAPRAATRVAVTTPSGHRRIVSIPAGHTVSVDITATVSNRKSPAAFAVSPIGPAPVYGVRVLSFPGAHGALLTAEPLLSLPAGVNLPEVRNDPNVALR